MPGGPSITAGPGGAPSARGSINNCWPGGEGLPVSGGPSITAGPGGAPSVRGSINNCWPGGGLPVSGGPSVTAGRGGGLPVSGGPSVTAAVHHVRACRRTMRHSARCLIGLYFCIRLMSARRGRGGGSSPWVNPLRVGLSPSLVTLFNRRTPHSRKRYRGGSRILEKGAG